MVYNLNVREEAKEDIIDAYQWYEQKSIGLGKRFVDEVEEMLTYIENYPEHFQIKYKSKYREGVMRIFPYVVIYEIIDNTVVVFSVFPAKNDPKKKPK